MVDPNAPRRYYAPLEDEPALFREFASIPYRPDGYRRFANRYGHLGCGDEVKLRGLGTVLAERQPAIWTFYEVVNLSVALLDAAASRDRDRLMAALTRPSPQKLRTFVITMGSDRKRADLSIPFGESAAPIWADPEDMARYESDPLERLVAHARLLAAVLVNTYLPSASLHMVVDWNTLEVTPRLLPGTLLGAISVQLMQAFRGEMTFRSCAACGRWYAVDPSRGVRSHRRYCSNRCRVAAHRQRIANARELRREGNSLREIAKRLESDPTTVRGWLGKPKAQ